MQESGTGVQYYLDEKRLGELELPYFMGSSKSMYYAPIDKAVYMPARFQFLATGEGIGLKGSLVLPKQYGKITAKSVMEKSLFIETLTHACENNEGLHKSPAILDMCNDIQGQLYERLALCTSDFIMLGRKYNYPSFLFSNKELIGISPSTVFSLEDGILMMSMEHTSGPYLSYFKKYGKTAVNVVILDEKGNCIVRAEANAEKAFNQTFVARKARIVRNSTWKDMVDQCSEIRKKYKGNYLMYFVDQI